VPASGIALVAFLVLSAHAAVPQAHAPAAGRAERDALRAVHAPRRTRPAILDDTQTIDANDARMFVTNFGSFAWDLTTGNPGFEFPRGSGLTAVFAGGLWLGALVNGTPRVTAAEYSFEYGPGAMIGGTYDDPTRSEYRTFKLLHDYPDNASREAALADYEASAVPHGAPVVHRVGSTSLDIVGTQSLWSVYNDADAGRHTANPGGTAPLGVEVRQTTFAFNDPGPLGRAVFLRYEILNRGPNLLQDLRVGLWADPDLGGPTDDLAGCVPADGMGYVYNGADNDALYGASPPAVGFDLVSGPVDPASGVHEDLRAFTVYRNGTDPVSSTDAWNRLAGLQPDGSPIIDPITGLPTTFMYNGDPISGIGWADPAAADKRFMPAAAPITLAPGQSVTVTWAIVVGQENGRLASVSRLFCDDRVVQAAFDAGFPNPLPARQACDIPINCVKPSDYWAAQCPAGSDFSGAQMSTIAQRVDALSTYFALGNNTLNGLCGVFGGALPKQQAEQEYMALLCNLAAGSPPVVPASGTTFFLDPGTPISCPGLAATTIGELTATAQRTVIADYVDHVPAHAVPIAGVDFGLPAFGGGAGTGTDLFGSSIDPIAQPDSFVHVELRFDATHPQKAYRYLRFEQPDGSPPSSYPGGRGYVYAGFHNVPFTCWDVDHGVQLEVGFVERAIVDDFGTIQPIGAQLATFDSTWSPDDSQFGSREYLFVFSRSYGSVAKPELAQDGLIPAGTGPVLYALAARRTDPGAVFDDGDAFSFAFDYPLGPSVDALLIRLATVPPAQANPFYSAIAACLFDINHGLGIGPTCDRPTATLASLVRADASPDRVSLAWLVTPAVPAELERQAGTGAWGALARLLPDGSGLVAYDDRDVVAGTRYGYRLRLAGGEVLGETAVDVPLAASLRLTGFVPNPALSLFDVAGRRVRALDVGNFGPGAHVVPVGTGLPSGVYLVRLEQSGKILTVRSALIR
jgi:hypothetical protein